MSDDIKVAVVKYPDRENYVMRYTDPITGKHVARSTKTHIMRDAERAAAKWEDELRTGRYKPKSRITWEEFRTKFEDQKGASLADGTADIQCAVFNHVESIINPKLLANLTAPVLSDFQTKLRDLKLSEPTIAGHLRHLRAVLSWAVSQGFLPAVPSIEMPKRAKGIGKDMRGRPITTEEYERMLEAVPQVRKREPDKWKRLLKGLWLSGLRLGEALALSWELDSPIGVHLAGKFPKLRIWAEGEKAHEDRLLPITPDFAEFLLSTPEAERQGLVFAITGPEGLPLSTKRASRYISAIGEKAKVIVNKADGKFASAHDLRRAFGTRWSKKVMPATLQKLMRHSAIETTLKHYVDQDADDIAADLWAMENKSNKVGNKAKKATQGKLPAKPEASA